MYPNYVSGLNPAQREAVTAPEGHLLINAAAGTGKTTTLASRILYLQLENDIPYDSILAVSFSRTAKMQLTERLEQLITKIGQGSQVPSFTFHGLAYRILRIASECGETRLRPGFALLAESPKTHDLYKEHANSLFSGLSDDWPIIKRTELYAKAINLVRQGHPQLGFACLRPADLPDRLLIRVPSDHSYQVDVQTHNVKQVWQRYEKLLRQKNSIDYPGLITEALSTLQHPNGQTRKRVCEGLRYMIIDEFQDTSRAQEQLMFCLAENDICLNVVGDDDQTIYTFNGSDVSNILDFTNRAAGRTFPVLPPVQLTENYRSSEKILSAANRVLRSIQPQRPKELRVGEKINAEPLHSYRERNHDIVRVHAPRLQLAAHYVAEEIQRLIEEESISPADIAVLVRKDTEFSPQGESVRQCLQELGYSIPVKKDPSERLRLLEIAQNVCQEHYAEELSEVLSEIQAGRLDSELEGVDRHLIAELLMEALASGAELAIEAFEYLYDIQREDDEAEITDTGQVQIRTVHSAKGQEFRVVFLMYIGERTFPHGARPDIEEEKRLFYVGLTRAQERLYIVGKPSSQTKTDFFSLIIGPGVRDQEFLAVGGVTRKTAVKPFSQDHTRVIDDARQRILEEEAKRQDELKKLFAEDDF